jgi:hypothetical protein
VTTENFEGPAIGLGKLLSDGRFLVPHHQREYSWTRDEIGQLFDDVQEAQKRGVAAYFLGLMVFIPGDRGQLVVLDGQQRLATVAIILAAVRTWLRQFSQYDADANQILSNYIGFRKLGKSEVQPRLALNETNNHIFVDYIVTDRTTEEIRNALSRMKRFDPNRRLLEATLYCRQRVDQIAAEAGSTEAGAESLFEIVDFLHDGVRIVRLTVSSEADAYTVFETLNDRGLDLTVLDLVKNYLFGKADTEQGYRLRDMKSRWQQMMSTLSGVRGDDFLRAFWTSRNGRIRITNLFPDLKKKHTTARSVVDLSVDMLEVSEQYAALDMPDDFIWSAYSQEARDRLRVLKLLGSSPVQPIMLSALHRFDVREMERLLRLLEVLLVRYQLVGGGSTGQLESTCAKLAHEIYLERVQTATAAMESLREIFPSDGEFEDNFAAKQERNNTKAQYILRRLEEEMTRRADGIMWDAKDPGRALTVEHVLPQKPGGEWKPIISRDPAIVEDCVYRLGNLCLLTKVNKDLGRKDFYDKKPTFEDTPLHITRDLAMVEEWNRETIEARQRRMAKLAVTAWRFQ